MTLFVLEDVELDFDWLEIVSNTEVWDIRTFHLLKTVPGLDQCYVSNILPYEIPNAQKFSFTGPKLPLCHRSVLFSSNSIG